MLINERLLGAEVNCILKEMAAKAVVLGGNLQSIQKINNETYFTLYTKTKQMFIIPENNIAFISLVMEDEEYNEFYGVSTE